MVNSTNAAIMNVYQGGLKHILHTENIEDNDTEISFPKIMSVHNTGENGILSENLRSKCYHASSRDTAQ